MAAPVLAVRELHKRYGRQEALAGVDLEVEAGQLVGLLGPNGAGKSTLTKIACGLVRPSGGGVEVLGRPAGSPQARLGDPQPLLHPLRHRLDPLAGRVAQLDQVEQLAPLRLAP
jgi:ABC-type cobalamin/Fe3+-siderophores transport system ATPase subunit